MLFYYVIAQHFYFLFLYSFHRNAQFISSYWLLFIFISMFIGIVDVFSCFSCFLFNIRYRKQFQSRIRSCANVAVESWSHVRITDVKRCVVLIRNTYACRWSHRPFILCVYLKQLSRGQGFAEESYWFEISISSMVSDVFYLKSSR